MNGKIDDTECSGVLYTKFASSVSEIIDIEWQFKNLSDLNTNVGFLIQSPCYPSKQNPQVKWYLQWFPNGVEEKDRGYCCLVLNKEGLEDVVADFSVALMNSHNEQSMGLKRVNRLFLANSFGYVYRRYTDRAHLMHSTVILDNTLTIVCKIYIKKIQRNVNITPDGQINNRKRMHDGQIKPSIVKSEDLSIGKFFGNNKFSDIQLILKEETFNAHKVILCSASPIFMKMLENLKGHNPIVHVADISAKIMKEMLRYIYTGEVENLSDVVHELVAVAHKYDIEGLKDKCEKCLRGYLTVDNLLDMLKIASSYGLSKLYVQISHLFLLNKSKIVSTPQFMELEASHPRIISKLLISLVADKQI